MNAYVPLLGEKKAGYRVSSRALTVMLMANAALICVVLCFMHGSATLGAPVAARTRAAPMYRINSRPATRAFSAITNYESFKNEMNSKYPDKWTMKGDAMYTDFSKQFDEKIKFLNDEVTKLEGSVKSPKDMENEDAGVPTDGSAILATVLLAGLPVLTIAGLVTGVISTVQPE